MSVVQSQELRHDSPLRWTTRLWGSATYLTRFAVIARPISSFPTKMSFLGIETPPQSPASSTYGRWTDLPRELTQQVFSHLMTEDVVKGSASAAAMRLVCRSFASDIASVVTHLHPRRLAEEDVPSPGSLARFRGVRCVEAAESHCVVDTTKRRSPAAVDPRWPAVDRQLSLLRPLTNLTHLGLACCYTLSDEGVRVVVQLSSLTSLDLKGCYRVTDRGVSLLSSLPRLQRVNLGRIYQLTDVGVKGAFGRTDHLTSLGLECTLVTDAAMASLQHHTSLAELCLGGCLHLTDAGLRALQPITSLTALDINTCCEVSSAGMTALAPLTALRTLSLDQCLDITSSSLRELRPLTRLESLSVEGCFQVTDTGMTELEHMTSITELNLTRCTRISDRGLVSLLALPNLRSVNLRSCINVTAAGLAMVVTGSTRLEHLNVAGCRQVTPADIESMTRYRPLLRSNVVS